MLDSMINLGEPTLLRSRGTAWPDSDLDFLVYSPEEVDQWKDVQNHVIVRALADGKVLYERNRAGAPDIALAE